MIRPFKPSGTSTHPQPSFNRLAYLSMDMSVIRPLLARCSSSQGFRPTFCRTHSPASQPHFTYSAHTTHPPRRHSATVLQPPHQPSFNRLPTTTHTLLARDSSHLPRQGRTSSSLPRRADLRQPQPNLNRPSTIRTSPELVSAFGT